MKVVHVAELAQGQLASTVILLRSLKHLKIFTPTNVFFTKMFLKTFILGNLVDITNETQMFYKMCINRPKVPVHLDDVPS